MSKKEVLSEIMYELKLREFAEFEVDGQDMFCVERLSDGTWNICLYDSDWNIGCPDRTQLRKQVAKLGKEFVLM